MAFGESFKVATYGEQVGFVLGGQTFMMKADDAEAVAAALVAAATLARFKAPDVYELRPYTGRVVGLDGE